MAKIKKIKTARKTISIEKPRFEGQQIDNEEQISDEGSGIDVDATSSDEAGNDSDREEEMKQKLFQIQKNLPWVNTLDVTASPDLVYEGAVSNDFEREAFFYKQAQSGALVAIQRLQKLRVRRRLLEIQKSKERRETIRRLREEKKFATKVQKAELERKRTEKKKLMEAVKKHRAGMKSQLDAMLNNATKLVDEEEESKALAPKSFSKKGQKNRFSRDKKYGFGGQKKRSKMNDKESVNDVFGGTKRRKSHVKPKMKRRR